MTRRAVLLLTGLLTAAPAAVQDKTDAVITLERTPCFGTCPVYSVRITSDGAVDYEGKQFVRITGLAHATIPTEDVARLVDEFEKSGYFSLQDNYKFVVRADGSRAYVTDLPTTTTSIQIGTRRKKIENYVGAPEALRDLERRIDAVAGTMRWISVTPDVVLDLQGRGWNAAGDDGAAYLRSAIQRGDAETVEALLEAGADPNGGLFPPLFIARHSVIIRALVAAGGNVNASANGEPLLIWAVRSGRAEVVSALLQAGAPVNATNERGQAALAVAIERAAAPAFPGDDVPPPHDFDRIAAILRAAGAK
jgi:hypothetical protein